MIERDVFAAALNESDSTRRAAYLEEACKGDAALRQRVESLLAEHEQLGSFMEAKAPEVTTDDRLSERPGAQIGPYKLLQQIGEGGFGVVFMAEQVEPVRRRVALKVIKPGMDTRQVIARFEAERQALAVMDHPNIARVFDAGATESGRPYFVMELVRGVPITQFCDENNLSVRERLTLFATVCQAIQHAHTKGIIHRDVKPTNVLVTQQEGVAVVKVIDFGIAKAMGQQLTDKTLFTEFAQMIGTPLYMSPEQAELSSADIDTRSDIYSLGVLLYELLTGTTPVSKEQLKRAAFDEIRRIIREDEPQKPSNRISTTDAAPSIAAQRHSEPAKLARLVRGELDWIVMKALEKDRRRRFETASSFAADIERYLNDEAVEACPPSAGYRFRKFARRNRAILTMTSFVTFALLLGIAGTTWQAISASGQRDRAIGAERLASKRLKSETRARRDADKQRKLAEANSQRAARNLREARKVVDDWFTKISQTSLLEAPGLQPLRRGLLEAAAGYYRGLLEQSRDDPDLRADLAAAHMRLSVIYITFDRNEDSMAEMLQGLDLVEQLIRERPQDTAFARRLAGYFKTSRDLYQGSQRPKDALKAVAILKRSAEIWEKFASDNPDMPEFRGDLAGMYLLLSAIFQSSDVGLSLDYCLRSRVILDELVPIAPGVDSYQDLLLLAINDQAFLLSKQQTPQNGDQVMRQAIVFLEDVSRRHSSELSLRLNVARLHHELAFRLTKSDPVEAEKVFRQALDLLETLVVASPASAPFRRQLVATFKALAIHLKAVGRVAESEEFQNKASAVNEKLVLDFPDASDFRLGLAKRHRLQGEQKKATDPIEAEQAYRRALAIHEALAIDFPDDKRLLDELKLCQEQLIALLKKPEHAAEMAILVRRFLDHHQALAKKSPSSPESRLAFANRCNDLGYALRGVGLRSEAEALVRQGLQIKLELAAEFPNVSNYRWHLAHSHLGLAIIAGELKRESEAISANAEAGKIFSSLLADESADADFRDRNAHALWRVGETWETLKRSEEAKQVYEQALVAFQQLEKANPTNRFYRQEQGFSYRMLSRLAERAGRFGEVLPNQREAVAIYQQLSDDVPDSTFYRGELAYVQMRLVDFLVRDGQIAAAEPHLAGAIANNTKLYAISPGDRAKQHGFAQWLNNVTWPLAMKSNPTEETIRLTSAMSKRSLELNPAAGHIWNTAAMVRYRAGDWSGARSAYDKASELGYQHATRSLFAAMIHWRVGEFDAARKHFDVACQSMDKNPKVSEDLANLRKEAEALLEQEKPD